MTTWASDDRCGQRANELQPVHAGHFQVGHDHVGRPAVELLECFDGTAATAHFMPGVLQDIGHGFAGTCMVIYHEHVSGRERASPWTIMLLPPCCGTGRRMVNAAPPCGQLLADTSPPWAVAIRSTIASPNPVPPLLVVKNGSKSCGWLSSPKPGPLSATSSSTPKRPRVAITASSPPWGMASTALRIRLSVARRSMSRSAWTESRTGTSSSVRIPWAAN